LGGNCGRHVLGGPARTCRSLQIIRYGMMSTGAKPRWHPSDAVSVDAGAMCGRQRHQRRFGRTPLSSGLPPTADMRTSAGFRRCGPEAIIRSPRRRERAQAHSGNPAFRRPSIDSLAFDCLLRALHEEIVKAGSVSSTRAAASRASVSRPRWAKADARQR